MQFHQMCGENVQVSPNGRIARRVDSFCKGVAFGSRPVKVEERVFLRFLECSTNWSGVLRFGFTANDPSLDTVQRDLPRYVCPDMTNKPGNWAKALGERYAEGGNILFYYVTATGDVRYGVNDNEKGVFFSGVNTSGPLWPLLDLYGNSTAVEFLGKYLCPITIFLFYFLNKCDLHSHFARISHFVSQSLSSIFYCGHDTLWCSSVRFVDS